MIVLISGSVVTLLLGANPTRPTAKTTEPATANLRFKGKNFITTSKSTTYVSDLWPGEEHSLQGRPRRNHLYSRAGRGPYGLSRVFVQGVANDRSRLATCCPLPKLQPLESSRVCKVGVM